MTDEVKIPDTIDEKLDRLISDVAQVKSDVAQVKQNTSTLAYLSVKMIYKREVDGEAIMDLTKKIAENNITDIFADIRQTFHVP